MCPLFQSPMRKFHHLHESPDVCRSASLSQKSYILNIYKVVVMFLFSCLWCDQQVWVCFQHFYSTSLFIALWSFFFQLYDFYNSSYFCTKSFMIIFQFWGFFCSKSASENKRYIFELFLWILFLSIKMVNRQTGSSLFSYLLLVNRWNKFSFQNVVLFFCFCTLTTGASLNAEHRRCCVVELSTCRFSCETSSSQIILIYYDMCHVNIEYVL